MKIFIIFLSLPKVYIQPPLWYTRRAMKRIFLFVVTNLAVMLVMLVAFHVLCAVMGVDPNGTMQLLKE